MSVGKQDRVWILCLKGNSRHWLEQLGIGRKEEELSIPQRTLLSIAKKQNFDSTVPGQPLWALGALVFVSARHASEIQAAIAENNIDLKAHHLIVSDMYKSIIEELLKNRVGQTNKEKYQSTRNGIAKREEQVPAKTFSHSESMNVIGPVSYTIAEVPLTMRRTFLDCAASVGGSDETRKTRSTGDRPLPILPTSNSAYPNENLPPRDADYGVLRKKFKMRGLKKDFEGEALSDALPPTSQETSQSACTQDLDDFENDEPAPESDITLLGQLSEKHAESLRILDTEASGLTYLGDPLSEQIEEISTYLLERSEVCMRIFSDYLDCVELPPACIAASSALEASEERKASIKTVLRLLRKKAETFLVEVYTCLGVHSVFGDSLYGEHTFCSNLEDSMIHLLTHLQRISGLSVLADAESKSGGYEVDTLKNATKRSVETVYHRSLKVDHIRELLEKCQRKKQPQPWKHTIEEDYTESEDEADKDWADLTPYERYLRKREMKQHLAIRKLLRKENRQRNAPNKRGVPGAYPRRGKNVA